MIIKYVIGTEYLTEFDVIGQFILLVFICLSILGSVLLQVENEYGNVEWAYGVAGELYVKWAAATAVGLNTTVPWVMCAQEDAPDPIVSRIHQCFPSCSFSP